MIYDEMQHILEPIKDVKRFVLENNIFQFLSQCLIRCSSVLFSLIENPDTKCFAAYTIGIENHLKQEFNPQIEECFYLIDDFSTLTEWEFSCFDDTMLEGVNFVSPRTVKYMLNRGANPSIFDCVIYMFCMCEPLKDVKELCELGCSVSHLDSNFFNDDMKMFIEEKKGKTNSQEKIVFKLIEEMKV